MVLFACAFDPAVAAAADIAPIAFRAPAPWLRLVGSHGGGHGARTFQPAGWYAGAAGGYAVMLGARTDDARDALGFGGHVGYRFVTGLSLDLRADDLGVDPPSHHGALVATGGGLRFTAPLVVMPFAEVHAGPTWAGSDAVLGVDGAVGVEIPVARHFELELSARDWIADIAGAVRHTPFFAAGFVFGFDGAP